jgi:hypothetical protein
MSRAKETVCAQRCLRLLRPLPHSVGSTILRLDRFEVRDSFAHLGLSLVDTLHLPVTAARQRVCRLTSRLQTLSHIFGHIA